MSIHRFNTLIVGLTVGLFALPILLDVLVNGWTQIVSLFAADAYYYLTVARSFAEQGRLTFDGQFETNGFHPLWQILLGELHILTNLLGLATPGVMVATLLVCVASISASIVLLAKMFLFEIRRLPVAFLILPFGVFAVFTYLLDRFTGTLWSHANGMESAVTILSYALLGWLMVKPKFLENYTTAVLAGLLLAMLLLARLDHGFFAVAFFAVVGLRTLVYREWRKFLPLVAAGLVAAAVAGLYLLSNQLVFGTFMPVSGTLKSTYPWVLSDKFPVMWTILNDPTVPYAVALSSRFSKIALPMVPAAVFVLWSLYLLWRRNLRWLDTFFAVTSVFVLMLGAYDILYVPLWYQGEWYFPVSLLYMSLLLVYVFARLPDRSNETGTVSRLSWVGIGVLSVVAVLYFATVYWDKDRRSHYTNFFTRDGPSMVAYYAPDKPKLIEVDDGIVGYATGLPTMSWLGFTLDVDGVAAKRKGQLLELALDRGFDRIASVNYFSAKGMDPATPSDVIKQKLGSTFFLTPKQVEGYRFKIEWVSQNGLVAVIHVERDPQARPDSQ